jgi:hypothetical protein
MERTPVELKPADQALLGWKIIRTATEAEIGHSEPPAAGRFVLAAERLITLRNNDQTRVCTDLPRLALAWPGRHGDQVVRPVCPGGLLLAFCTGEATWLPAGWELFVFPAGWRPLYVEGWFKYALDEASYASYHEPSSNRSGGACHLPTPLRLVAHGHLIARHLKCPGRWQEPRGALGCRDAYLAELRELRDLCLCPGRPDPAAACCGEEAIDWTPAELVSHWAKVFNVNPDKMARLLKSQKIRNKDLSTKLYMVAVDDLPLPQKVKYRYQGK